MLTDKQTEVIKKALRDLVIAEEALKAATKELATFGENVPSLNVKATKLFCESLNEINKNMQFAMSFVRVSTIQQLVYAKK